MDIIYITYVYIYIIYVYTSMKYDIYTYIVSKFWGTEKTSDSFSLLTNTHHFCPCVLGIFFVFVFLGTFLNKHSTKVSPWRGKKKTRTRGTWTPDILWPKHQKVYHPHGQATSTWVMSGREVGDKNRQKHEDFLFPSRKKKT